VHNNEEEGMKLLMRKKFSGHECDPKKIIEISKCNFLDLVNKNNQARDKLSDVLTLMASYIITASGQKPLYLHIEELTEQNDRQLLSWIKKEDYIDLGNIKEIKESHWANRAIKQERVRDKLSECRWERMVCHITFSYISLELRFLLGMG
jgi:hypothetical protein